MMTSAVFMFAFAEFVKERSKGDGYSSNSLNLIFQFLVTLVMGCVGEGVAVLQLFASILFRSENFESKISTWQNIISQNLWKNITSRNLFYTKHPC